MAQENHLQDGLMVHVVGHLQRGHPAAGRERLPVSPDGPYAESTPPPAAQLTPAPAMTAPPCHKSSEQVLAHHQLIAV